MPTTNLGRVGFVPKGLYSETATYKRLDCVVYNGNTYAALKDTTGINPENTFNWQMLVDNSDATEALNNARNALNRANEASNSIPTEIQNEIAKLTDNNADMAEVISARTTADETAYPTQKARLDAQYNELKTDIRRIDYKTGTHMYGILWDKTTATCTRQYDAVGMEAAAHLGTYNANLVNDFDNVYPWSHRKLCTVDLTEYSRLYEAGADIEQAITAWEGDPDFSYTGENGAVMVYTPAFYMHTEETDEGVLVAIADGELEGWIKVPRYIGGRYTASDDGNGGLTSVAEVMPISRVTLGNIHKQAKTNHMTLEDLWTFTADTALMAVEFATLNMQAAIGNGVSSLYRENEADLALVTETATNRVIVPNALASYAIPGAIIDIGTSLGGAQVGHKVVIETQEYPDNTAYKIVVFAGDPVDVTASNFCSIHGLWHTVDAEIGSSSGYIGTNSRSHAYYRGRIAYANVWRYVLGAYREQNTGHIWIAHDREEADAYDALNKTVHTDTGFVLPYTFGEDGTAPSVGTYINDIHFHPDLPLLPFAKTCGGNSEKPIGDYVYLPPSTTGNTIQLVGGAASHGVYCGRFCGRWHGTSGSSRWGASALLFLK